MAEDKHEERGERIHLQDVAQVGSRVGWGGIIAGAVMALAVMFLLSLLGAAIGLSVADQMTAEGFGIGAAVWAVASMIVALFLGGFITSQCVVGETKTEAVVQGVIMWGVALAMLLWFTSAGIGFGVGTMMQAAQSPTAPTWQQMARLSGVPETQIQEMTRAMETGQPTRLGTETQRTAMQATWWTFGGTLLSIIAAVGGALVGAGPTFRLLPMYTTPRGTYESRTAGG
jgi:hypothetical protein